MRKRRSRSDESLVEPLINLTPLIDVVFVVLISFILIAPFLQVDSLFLAPSGTNSRSASNSPSLTLVIRADNSLLCNGKEISFSQLDALLVETKKKSPASIPQLIPDARAHFAAYQRVKNSLENAGFTQMEILLKEQD